MMTNTRIVKDVANTIQKEINPNWTWKAQNAGYGMVAMEWNYGVRCIVVIEDSFVKCVDLTCPAEEVSYVYYGNGEKIKSVDEAIVACVDAAVRKLNRMY